ncbi:transporter [Bacteroides sp. 214]|uniref:bile acid:sodium symporter family protein n=1 Tax=Bacteroides sp. 214 TaxID=2302935 RepID=UPI0013D11952|nr:transporter [Bacteroides sp. 214]NDW11734.1 transporter [Bacteroides sp. 214]
MITFLKNWTLPVAMLMGVLGYPLFGRLGFLTPYLIFAMLLLTFCKLSLSELKPRPLHFWLLLIQMVGALAAYLLLAPVNKILAQGLVICFICPTATSAAVITAKLGGSAASVSCYTLLINIGVAIAVPLFFPLIESKPDITFWQASLAILSRVFLLLICPIITAWIIQRYLLKAQRALAYYPDLAFYLWAFALTIISSQILSTLLHYDADMLTALLMAGSTLVLCCLQFFLGKTIGSVYNDRVSGGQALGQKNTILAIWMAQTYLNPLSAIGPGFYVLWQNVVNSWQLWKKRKKEETK